MLELSDFASLEIPKSKIFGKFWPKNEEKKKKRLAEPPKSGQLGIQVRESSRPCLKILRIDLYSNSHIVNRVSVFLERSVHAVRSRKKDLVKKLGQKDLLS